MNRVDVLQGIIDRKRAKHYLEIGVQSGDTFMRLKARKKMAVDPRFLISRRSKLDWIRWNGYNLFNEYYEMPSDDFFASNSQLLGRRGLDVVFIDGLHTFEQSLRDVEHTLLYLREGGVIVLDDCNPPTEEASNPIKPPNNNPWTGDVWKTVAYLRSAKADLNVFVLDCVYGLGIVTRGSASDRLDYSEQDIGGLTYADLVRDRAHFLNLKGTDYFNEFIQTI